MMPRAHEKIKGYPAIMQIKSLKASINFFHTIRHNRYMIRSMVLRDIRERYVGSFLGFFWTIIHPLTQMAIYYFIFSVILKLKLGSHYGGTNFGIWLICGLLPWFFFTEVVERSPGAILNQADIIKKTVFPSEILSLTLVLSAALNHFIGLSILIIFLLVAGLGLTFKILLVFPLIVLTGLFAIGISWTLSALNVFFRDIGQIISVILNIWFFGTPIIYPFHRVPEQFQIVFKINPMYHMIEAYRWALLGKTELDAEALLMIGIPMLMVFIVGGFVFKRLKPAFADVL